MEVPKYLWESQVQNIEADYKGAILVISNELEIRQ